ncbi:MAG: hypothetical protein OEW99_07930 [Gammaproteobacteria bacterium]|nr:hypothetical protein [Gammaproteobacteria bacterium]
MFEKLTLLFNIGRAHGIARRYFIVNGFDGALTMLGLIMGFYVSEHVNQLVVLNACLGAAIALGMSGLTSAYISEAAEKKKELHQLEDAMVKDLGDSAYGQATRLLPFLIALVNGLAPLVISLFIILPLWSTRFALIFPFAPLETALLMSLAVVFMLGVFLGRISETFWLWAGLRTLLVAAATAGLIFLLSPHH